AATSPLAPWVAVPPAVLTALLWTPWTRVSRWVPLLVGLTCIAQTASGAPIAPASAMGVLVLLHVVLADLAADAVGASASAVGRAGRDRAPGLAAGAAAAVALALGITLATALPEPWLAVLRPAAPVLLLVAGLLALGIASRRPQWGRPPQRGGLS